LQVCCQRKTEVLVNLSHCRFVHHKSDVKLFRIEPKLWLDWLKSR